MQVEILAGKDKGKQGHVALVIRRLNRVIVGGLNTVSTSSKTVMCGSCIILPQESRISDSLCSIKPLYSLSPSSQHIRVIPASGSYPGGRIASEAPLHVSNVALVDPANG